MTDTYDCPWWTKIEVSAMYLHLHPPGKALELPGAPGSSWCLPRAPATFPGSSWELPGVPAVSREFLGALGRPTCYLFPTPPGTSRDLPGAPKSSREAAGGLHCLIRTIEGAGKTTRYISRELSGALGSPLESFPGSRWRRLELPGRLRSSRELQSSPGSSIDLPSPPAKPWDVDFCPR